MDVDPNESQRLECADLDLRSTPGIVAPRTGGEPSILKLSRDRTQAGGIRRADGIYSRRISAAHRASVLRLLGLSNDGLLRGNEPVRHASRSDVSHRLSAPASNCGHSRLGAFALPHRRIRPRLFRRNTSVRTLRPAHGRPQGLGQLYFQLWPARSAQLPVKQRDVLARSVSHRWFAGRCRGFHAVPRLFETRGRVDSEHVWGPRESGGDRVSSPVQHRSLQTPLGRTDARGGVNGLANGFPPDICRRPRFRFEMGYGMDARHTDLHDPRSYLSQVPP